MTVIFLPQAVSDEGDVEHNKQVVGEPKHLEVGTPATKHLEKIIQFIFFLKLATHSLTAASWPRLSEPEPKWFVLSYPNPKLTLTLTPY